MNITRNGKIARLPKTVRDELNQRLANGERGTELVAWLNSLPEVQCIVTEQFGGKPVRAQNLSEWKQGGYKDWINRQEAMELARQLPAEAAALKSATGELPSDILATWLTAHYAVAAHQLKDTGVLGLKQFGKLIRDVSVLRRGDHSAQRLKLEQAKLEHARKQTEEEMVAQFVRWAKNSAVQELLRRHAISAEERGVEATDGGEVSQRVSAPRAWGASSTFRVQGSKPSETAKRTRSTSGGRVTRVPICFEPDDRNGSVAAGDFTKRTPSRFADIGVDSWFNPKMDRIGLNPTFEIFMNERIGARPLAASTSFPSIQEKESNEPYLRANPRRRRGQVGVTARPRFHNDKSRFTTFAFQKFTGQLISSHITAGCYENLGSFRLSDSSRHYFVPNGQRGLTDRIHSLSDQHQHQLSHS